MNDLIRRQDAIDVVAKEYQYESDRITALQKIPAVELPTWIPCSERLPEENRDGWTELLLSIKTGEVILGFWHDTETGFCRRFMDGVCSAGGVVAWMPLPPAFKGE